MNRFVWVLVILIGASSPSLLAADRGVRLVQTVIPMPDGVKLAATLYMPADLKRGERVPALLEYLPYRKDDDQILEDYGHHAYFARHGFVGVRVDIRGFGNSQGVVPPREYSAQEQEDGERVIAWLARQRWSNGNVGMLGISWGGFNAIQMAMRRPPALKAILATAATEALFTEDVHYMDGILHLDEFEVAMDLDQGRSGAPDFPLDEDTLSKRMDSPPWSLDYFRHQRDGAFWQAPVRKLEDIRIPCFLIGGLQDGYRNSVARMLEHVPAPVQAWLGPWNHAWPNDSIYGPEVEWRDRAVRWFDHWLKGIDNGVERDPRLLIYQQHSHPPGGEAQVIPGDWRAENWPPQGLEKQRWFLGPHHELSRSPTAESATEHLRYVPSAGAAAGFWWGELLGDQRPADTYSLVYESAPLEEPLAILGRARATLRAAASASLADWVVRLEDEAPDGEVTAITGAGLNGAQRDSLTHPAPLIPDREYTLNIDLYLTSWVWERGHRIRLSVSNAQWPMFWPTPYAMTTSLRLGAADGSSLLLPVVPLKGGVPPQLAAPEAIEAPDGVSTTGDYAWPGTWKFERDEGTGRSTVSWSGTSAFRFPWGSFEHTEKATWHVDDAHPDAASAEGEGESIERLPDRTLLYRGRLELSSDATTLHYRFTRELLRDGTVVRSRSWREDILRDFQ
jgi:putative CocE/NonD family hydrolase